MLEKMAMETWTLVATNSYFDGIKGDDRAIRCMDGSGFPGKAISGWEMAGATGMSQGPSASVGAAAT